MSTGYRVVKPQQVDRLPSNINDPREITLGMVVYDRVNETAARVRGVRGRDVELQRPGGTPWTVNYIRLRRATPHEVRQIVALGKLRRDQERGRHPLP
ncbi:hypothetical protein [Streptomyces flavidovirens]